MHAARVPRSSHAQLTSQMACRGARTRRAAAQSGRRWRVARAPPRTLTSVGRLAPSAAVTSSPRASNGPLLASATRMCVRVRAVPSGACCGAAWRAGRRCAAVALQVAACCCLQVAAYGCKWLQVAHARRCGDGRARTPPDAICTWCVCGVCAPIAAAAGLHAPVLQALVPRVPRRYGDVGDGRCHQPPHGPPVWTALAACHATVAAAVADLDGSGAGHSAARRRGAHEPPEPRRAARGAARRGVATASPAARPLAVGHTAADGGLADRHGGHRLPRLRRRVEALDDTHEGRASPRLAWRVGVTCVTGMRVQ
jgi:hypothetical protein